MNRPGPWEILVPLLFFVLAALLIAGVIVNKSDEQTCAERGGKMVDAGCAGFMCSIKIRRCEVP